MNTLFDSELSQYLDETKSQGYCIEQLLNMGRNHGISTFDLLYLKSKIENSPSSNSSFLSANLIADGT